MPYLGTVGLEFQKLLSYLKSAPLNFPSCKILWKKQKFLNLGPKISYLGVLWLELKEKTIVIFEISTLGFFLIVKYCELIKMPKFGTKSALYGYFDARILNNYCHIWNQHPGRCLTAKFCEETKMFKFGTKNALFV